MSTGKRSWLTSLLYSSISLRRRSLSIASSFLKTRAENFPISTNSCMSARPKCAPHLLKRRPTNVSRSHGPDDFLDPRDSSAEAIRDPRHGHRPEASREQGPGSAPQGVGRLGPSRTPEPTRPRSVEPRKTFEIRGKTYRLRSSEIQ